jgi:hypothetical protein
MTCGPSAGTLLHFPGALFCGGECGRAASPVPPPVSRSRLRRHLRRRRAPADCRLPPVSRVAHCSGIQFLLVIPVGWRGYCGLQQCGIADVGGSISYRECGFVSRAASEDSLGRSWATPLSSSFPASAAFFFGTLRRAPVSWSVDHVPELRADCGSRGVGDHRGPGVSDPSAALRPEALVLPPEPRRKWLPQPS